MQCMSSHTAAGHWARAEVFSGNVSENVDTRESQLTGKPLTTYVALSSLFTVELVNARMTRVYRFNLILSILSFIRGISSLFHVWGWVSTVCKVLLPIFVWWHLMSNFHKAVLIELAQGSFCVRTKSWGWLYKNAHLMSEMVFGIAEQHNNWAHVAYPRKSLSSLFRNKSFSFTGTSVISEQNSNLKWKAEMSRLPVVWKLKNKC